jgi:hypothetical protein
MTAGAPSSQQSEAWWTVPRREEFRRSQGVEGGIKTGKLSLPYGRDNLCATRAVNLLLKIVSARSRALPGAADTVFDP